MKKLLLMTTAVFGMTTGMAMAATGSHAVSTPAVVEPVTAVDPVTGLPVLVDPAVVDASTHTHTDVNSDDIKVDGLADTPEKGDSQDRGKDDDHSAGASDSGRNDDGDRGGDSSGDRGGNSGGDRGGDSGGGDSGGGDSGDD